MKFNISCLFFVVRGPVSYNGKQFDRALNHMARSLLEPGLLIKFGCNISSFFPTDKPKFHGRYPIEP